MFEDADDVETYLGVLDAVFMVSYAVVCTSSCVSNRICGVMVRASANHFLINPSHMQICRRRLKTSRRKYGNCLNMKEHLLNKVKKIVAKGEIGHNE